jgi:hypothetical protein
MSLDDDTYSRYAVLRLGDEALVPGSGPAPLGTLPLGNRSWVPRHASDGGELTLLMVTGRWKHTR